MDRSRFDALARTLGHGESRRWLLGRLGGTTLGGLLAGMTAESDARKRKKKKNKKKTCKGCTECQTCRKGKCQAKPEGTACSTGACQEEGICSCTVDLEGNSNCPAGCLCGRLYAEESGSICVQDEICERPLCETGVECGQGEVCLLTFCEPDPSLIVGRCVAVCGA